MFVGPIFARELLTTPRRPLHYILRATYVVVLFVLMWTAWQAIVGFRTSQRLGDFANFNSILFQLLAAMQLALVLFVASLYGAGAISHEKDRRTFVLLLITRLYDSEIVVSKFMCSMLQVASIMVAALPCFVLTALMGGVSYSQILQVYAVTLGTALAGAALGVLVAVWREKTFQSVAMTMLAISLILLAIEIPALLTGDLNDARGGIAAWRDRVSPIRALGDAISGSGQESYGWSNLPASWFNLLIQAAFAAVCLTIATLKLRAWNPRGEAVPQLEEDSGEAVDPRTGKRRGKSRPVWTNPVLWREMRTRAYGAKPILIKGGYLLIFALLLGLLLAVVNQRLAGQVDGPVAIALAAGGLGILSLLLINAQAVTAVTSERDLRSLDLLLATDVTPREFIYGKLFGILYNSKEMVVAPIVFLSLCAARGLMGPVGWFYAVTTFLVFVAFATVLGIHSGMRHDSTRLAIVHSLGTMFLLFVGILICWFLIRISGNFEAQWGSFILFIVLGSVGLWVSLSANAPSNAIALTAFITPFATFYCLIAFIVGDRALPFLVGSGAYGFGVLAMMIPLLSEFDVATGRTTIGEG